MAIITKYFSKPVTLYVSQPYLADRHRQAIQSKLDDLVAKPAGLVDDDGMLNSVSPAVDVLNDEYEDRSGQLMTYITKSHLQSNVLMAVMGSLLLTDIADYIDVTGLKTITVDKFIVDEDDINIVFKIVADDSADMDLIVHELDSQISDGWGEDGTKEVPFDKDSLLEPGFFNVNSMSLEEAMFDLNHYETMPPDVREIMYTDNYVSALTQGLTYDPRYISLRLAFGYENLRAFED